MASGDVIGRISLDQFKSLNTIKEQPQGRVVGRLTPKQAAEIFGERPQERIPSFSHYKTEAALGPPGDKGWKDAFADVVSNPASYLPYVNFVDIFDSARVFNLSNKVANGNATKEEKQELDTFLAEQQRGGTFGYKVWNTALRIPAYAIEFMTAGGIIKGGAKGVIRKGFKEAVEASLEKGAQTGAAAAAGAAAREVAEAATEGFGKKLAMFLAEDTYTPLVKHGSHWARLRMGKFGERAAARAAFGQAPGEGILAQRASKEAALIASRRALGQAAVEAPIRATLQAHRVVDGTLRNMTHQFALTPDEHGAMQRILVDEGDGFWKAFAKAYGDMTIENFSEQTGQHFILLKGMFGPAAKPLIKSAFLSAASRKIATTTGERTPEVMKRLLRNHFFGRGERVGFIEKAGWQGVFAEMGEEAIGGALRQATGINPIGLPSLEDVAAMAVGFALNPMSIGAAAYDTGLDAIADAQSNVYEAIEQARKQVRLVDDTRVTTTDALQTPENVTPVVDLIYRYMEQFGTEGRKQQDASMGLWGKFKRAITTDVVQRRIGQILGQNLGKKYDQRTADQLGYNRHIYDLEALVRNMEGLSRETALNLAEHMLELRVASTEDIENILLSAAGEGRLPMQYWPDGTLRGFSPDGISRAPYFLLEKGTIDPDEYDALVMSAPWLADVQAYTTDPNAINIKQEFSNERRIPDVDDDNLAHLANIMGVDPIKFGRRRGKAQAIAIVDLKAAVQERVDFINGLMERDPGLKVAYTNMLIFLDTRENFRGQPVAAQAQAINDQNEILLTMGAHYQPQMNRIILTPHSRNSDAVEDVLESIFMDSNGQVDPYVEAAVAEMRRKNPNAPEIWDANAVELFSKAVKVLRLGYRPTNPNDLAQFVISHDVALPDDVDAYLNEKMKEKRIKPDLLSFLSKHLESRTEAAYDQKAEGFEPTWFVEQISEEDWMAEVNDYPGNRPVGTRVVALPVKLRRDFNEEIHGERYRSKVRAYLRGEFEKQRWDHKEFIHAMIDKHGRQIVPYLKRFGEELYSGEIKVNIPKGETKVQEPATTPKPKTPSKPRESEKQKKPPKDTGKEDSDGEGEAGGQDEAKKPPEKKIPPKQKPKPAPSTPEAPPPAPALSEAVEGGINISSYEEGLGGKLSNMALIPVEYNGREYTSAESAYQIQKEEQLGDDLTDEKVLALMTDIIEQKLLQHPDLVDEIDSLGGYDFLLKSSHDLIKDGKRVKQDRWTGRTGLFMKALRAAYLRVAEAEQGEEFSRVRDMLPDQYKGVPILIDTGLVTSTDGRAVGARYDRENNRILVNPELIEAKFEDKAWTKPQVQGVNALPEDMFQTLNDWVDFVLEHEFQHVGNPIQDEESISEYENRINQLALEELGLTEKKPPVPAPKLTSLTPAESAIDQFFYRAPNGEILVAVPEGEEVQIPVQDVWIFYEQNASDPVFREILQNLRRNIGSIPGNMILYGSEQPFDFIAAVNFQRWRPRPTSPPQLQKQKVEILGIESHDLARQPLAEAHMVHELIHYMTALAVEVPHMMSREQERAIKELLRIIDTHRDEILRALQAVPEARKDAGFPPATDYFLDPHEIISYTLTSREVRRVLDNIRDKGNPQQSILTSFVRAIMDFFGLTQGSVAYTIVENALTAIEGASMIFDSVHNEWVATERKEPELDTRGLPDNVIEMLRKEAEAAGEELTQELIDQAKEYYDANPDIAEKVKRDIDEKLNDQQDESGSHSLRPLDGFLSGGVGEQGDLFEDGFAQTDKMQFNSEDRNESLIRLISDLPDAIDEILKKRIGKDIVHKRANGERLSISELAAFATAAAKLDDDVLGSILTAFRHLHPLDWYHPVYRNGRIDSVEQSNPGDHRWRFLNEKQNQVSGFVMSSFGIRKLKQKWAVRAISGARQIRGRKRADYNDFSPEMLRDLNHFGFEQAVKEGQDFYWHWVGNFGATNTPIQIRVPVITGTELDERRSAYRTVYKSLDSKARRFYENPENLKSDADWNWTLNQKDFYDYMFGDIISTFGTPENMNKRLSQVFTPGVAFDFKDSQGRDGRIAYAVFDDHDLPEFDGAAWASKKLMDRWKQHVGPLLANENYFLLKGFGVYNADESGNYVMFKPMISDIGAVEEANQPWHNELAAYLAKLEAKVRANQNLGSEVEVILIPKSSMKVGGAKDTTGGQEVLTTPLLTVDDAKENVDFHQDAEPIIHVIKAKNLVVTADHNYGMNPAARSGLRQLESIILAYDNANIGKVFHHMNRAYGMLKGRVQRLQLADLMKRSLVEEGPVFITQGNVARAVRAGVPDRVILDGPEFSDARGTMSAGFSGLIRSMANRIMRTLVPSGLPPAQQKGIHRTEDGRFVVPMSIITAGNNMIDHQPETLSWGSREEFDEWMRNENNLNALKNMMPTLFNIDGDGNLTTFRDHLLVESSEGRLSLPGDIVITTRIPSSHVPFNMLATVEQLLSNGAAIVISDRKRQKATGADHDADAEFIDGLFRYNYPPGHEKADLNGQAIMGQSAAGEYNRAFLYLVQAMMRADPSITDEFERDIDLGLINWNTPIQLKPPLGIDGQIDAMRVMSDSQRALSIAAATSTTLRLLDQLTISGRRPFTIKGYKHLGFDRNGTEVVTMTTKERMDREYWFNNLLINLFVDDPKNPKIASLGYNRHTTPMLYAMIAGSPQLKGKVDSEGNLDIIEFLKEASNFFLTNPVVQDYVKYMETVDDLSNDDRKSDVWKHLLERHAPEEVSTIMELIDVSNEMRDLRSFLSVAYRSVPSLGAYESVKRVREKIEANTFQYFDLQNMTQGRSWHPLVWKAADAIDLYSRIYEEDPFWNSSTADLVFGEWAEDRDRSMFEIDAIRKKLAEVVIINALDNGRQMKKKDLHKRIKQHMEDHKDNDFIKLLEYHYPAKAMALTEDAGRRRAAPPIEVIQARRDAFDLLPEDVQMDFAYYNVMNYGTSPSQFRGGYGMYFGDAFLPRYYQQIYAESERWENGEVSEDEVAWMQRFLFSNKQTGYWPFEREPYTGSAMPLNPKTDFLINEAEERENLNDDLNREESEQQEEGPQQQEFSLSAVFRDSHIDSVFEGGTPIALTGERAVVLSPNHPGYSDSASLALRSPTSYSLRPIFDDLMTSPQFYTSGEKLLHGHWIDIRNKMREQTLIGSHVSQALLRMTAGAKGIGYAYRETDNGKFRVYDMDKPEGGWFKVVGTFDTQKQALDVINPHNRQLKTSAIDEALSDRILRAVTAVVEDPRATEMFEDFVYVTDADGNPVIDPETEEPERVRAYYVIRKHEEGYVDEVAGPFADRRLAREWMRNAGVRGSEYGIRKGYQTKTTPIAPVRDEVAAKFGAARFDQLVNMTIESLERGRRELSEETIRITGTEFVPEWGRQASSGYRYMPHFWKNRKRTREETSQTYMGREDSKRATQRKYNTYLQGARLRGLEPVNLNAAWLNEAWYKDVWGAAVNNSMIQLGTTMNTPSGAPLWIPILNTGAKLKDEDTDRVAFSNVHLSYMHDSLLRFLNMELRKRDRKVYVPDESLEIRDRINKTVSDNRKFLESLGYISPRLREGSRFNSVNDWLVKTDPYVSSSRARQFVSPSLQMLKSLENNHLIWTPFGGRNWLAGIERFNNWSKTISLSVSGFHPFALIESLIAAGGLTGENIARSMLPWVSKSWAAEIKNMRRLALADSSIAAKWARHGMYIDITNPNFDNDAFIRDLKAIQKWNKPFLSSAARMAEKGHKVINTWLWNEFFPGIKLYAAESMLTELRENANVRAADISEDQMMDEIAKTMNDAFGGQNWDQYLWATPEMRQLLHLIWFAPDWTLSAFNIAGASNLPIIKKVIQENQGGLQKEWELKRYWPAMAVIVMTAIPQAIQLAIYSMAKVLPGPDDDDALPFVFQNEPGKTGIIGAGIGGHIDITPLMKKFSWVPAIGYEGGDTGKRRIYLRWAKQANEVFEGWGMHPLRTFKSKTSAVVRAAFEQIAGENTAGWALGFKEEPFLTGIFAGEKGLTDGRIAYLARKFVPISVLTVLDGRPSSFFAPASRGMSLYQAQQMMSDVLMAYADDATWQKISKNQKWETNLASLGIRVIEAAERNGHKAEDVISGAKRDVLAEYYGKFFEALNTGHNAQLEKHAQSILRVNGSLRGMEKSMKRRFERAGKEFSPDLREQARRAFE